MREKEMPNAVFAGYGHIVIRAMRAFQGEDLRVPRISPSSGMAISGKGAYLPIPLTAVFPPIRDMTRVGMKLLLDKIKKRTMPSSGMCR